MVFQQKKNHKEISIWGIRGIIFMNFSYKIMHVQEKEVEIIFGFSMFMNRISLLICLCEKYNLDSFRLDTGD